MKAILEKDKLNVIIASNEDIEFLIKTSNSLQRVKYLQYQEVVDDFLGNYSLDSLLDLNRIKGLTFSNAKIILDNALILRDEEKDENYKYLLEIKKKYSKYLQKENINLKKYENSNIILYNYYGVDDLFHRALQKLEEQFEIKKFYSNKNIKSNIYFNEYSFIDDEVKGLVYKVAELLHNKVLSEDIVIINSNSEYDPLLRAYFNLANISLSDETVPLIHFEFVKKVIVEVFKLDDHSLLSSYNSFLKQCDKFTAKEKKLIQEISKIVSSFKNCTLNKTLLKDLLIYFLNKKTIVLNKYSDVINIENNLNNTYKHIFIIGLSNDKCSNKYKDNEYLSDKQRVYMNLLSSNDKNKEYQKKIIHYLKNDANFYLSYSINTKSGIKQKPLILDNFKYKIYKINDKLSYSKNIDELKFKILLEQYIKYHEESQELYDLSGNYKDVENKVYNNKFSGINNKIINKQLEKGLILSYTSIDEYYQCAFRYYIRRVLKIDKTSDEDPIIIGNIFHSVLSHVNEEDFDFEKYIDYYIISKNINIKGYFGHFINKYKKHLKILFPYIKEFHNNSYFTPSSLEASYEVVIDEEYGVVLKGFIDKVMTYDYLNHKYFLVIDYKTGNAKFDFRNLPYGLDMQLLIYFYLLAKYYPNYGFGGCYLQRILPTNISMYNGKSFNDNLRKSFFLDGYSNNDYAILNFICENIDNGEFIQGINFLKGSNTLNAYAKNRTFSDEEFNKLLTLSEKKIMEAKDNILKSNFRINPKKGKDIDSCKYCPYKDICYKTENDYVNLDEIKDYLFLEDK